METQQERSHARSEEEKDLLVPSNKKVGSGDIIPESRPQDVEMTLEFQTNHVVEGNRGTSFRDGLLGRSGMPMIDDRSR